jgi:hypothetical protein
MSSLPAWIEGIGLLGPGLPSWATAQGALRGEEPHRFVLSVLPAPPRLPPAERRRAGPVIRLAMAVAEEAVAQAQVDPQTLATVFTSSGGEGANCHSLCETLASENPLISPTRFTNSVHNAASGYWHIAVGSRQASTSLCAFDGSFGAGLIEAVTLMRSDGQPVLLVAYDLPYPEPLNSVRPLLDTFGLALMLTPEVTPRSLASLRVGMAAASEATPDTCADASLEALRRNLPAAAALPLLERLARGDDGRCTLTYLPQLNLRVDVQRTGALPIAPSKPAVAA